jgi:hypothetical protein
VFGGSGHELLLLGDQSNEHHAILKRSVYARLLYVAWKLHSALESTVRDLHAHLSATFGDVEVSPDALYREVLGCPSNTYVIRVDPREFQFYEPAIRGFVEVNCRLPVTTLDHPGSR